VECAPSSNIRDRLGRDSRRLSIRPALGDASGGDAHMGSRVGSMPGGQCAAEIATVRQRLAPPHFLRASLAGASDKAPAYSGKIPAERGGWRNHGATLPNCNPQVNPVPYPSGAPAYSGKSPAGGGVGGNWPYCAPEGPCRGASGPASPENRSRRSAKSVVLDQEPPRLPPNLLKFIINPVMPIWHETCRALASPLEGVERGKVR
jgi:hypothetical protein